MLTPPTCPWPAAAFDFDGTLTDYVQADLSALNQLRQAACPHAHPEAFVTRAVDEIMAFHDRVQAGTSDPLHMDLERLRRTLTAYGTACTPAHLKLYAQALLDASVPLPGAPELLRDLQALGVRLALLTNAYDGPAQRQRIRRCFPQEPFEVVVVCGETGALKPDPRPFQVLVQALALPPAQVVYIGDSPAHDVEGARGAGLPALHIHPHPRVQERARQLGAQAAVEHLTALRAHLGLRA